MNSTRIFSFFIALFLAVPLASSAAIVKYDFTGTITRSIDRQGDVFGLGAGDDTAVGELISGSYIIDPDLVPATSTICSSPPDRACTAYFGNTDWLTANVTVNGFSYDINHQIIGLNPVPPVSDASFTQILASEDTGGGGGDALSVVLQNIKFVTSATGVINDRSQLNIEVDGMDFLTGTSLAQEFSLAASDLLGITGTFEWSDDFAADTKGQYISGTNSIAFFDLTSFSAQVVPVPPAVWLFGTALLGLIGLGKRKKSVKL